MDILISKWAQPTPNLARFNFYGCSKLAASREMLRKWPKWPKIQKNTHKCPKNPPKYLKSTTNLIKHYNKMIQGHYWQFMVYFFKMKVKIITFYPLF